MNTFRTWLEQEEEIKRIHMAGKPFEFQNQQQRPAHKPIGLWYDCSGEWIRHLRRATGMPQSYYDAHHYYEVIPNFQRVLKIDTPEKFLAFEKQYGVARGDEPNKYLDAFLKSTDISRIDWPKVAMQYSGIEICPYQSQFRSVSDRRSHDWYAGWDVASGCIWAKDGLLELRPV